jgi:hypothetical protein
MKERKFSTNEPSTYVQQQSKEKQFINDKLLIDCIKRSNISENEQSALILESTELNTLKSLLKYNPGMKIHVPECNNKVCTNIQKNFVNNPLLAGDIQFYPGAMLDAEFIKTNFCEEMPNIIFADFTNTYQTNKQTIKRILKCYKNNTNKNKLVLALTFSLRNDNSPTDDEICKGKIRGKEIGDNENVMNCVTLSLLKIFYQNGFVPEPIGFERYRYQRNTLNGPVSTIEEMIERIDSLTQRQFEVVRRPLPENVGIRDKTDLILYLRGLNLSSKTFKIFKDAINSVDVTTTGQMMSLYLFNLIRIDDDSIAIEILKKIYDDIKQPGKNLVERYKQEQHLRWESVLGSPNPWSVEAQEFLLFDYPITDLNKMPLYKEFSWQESKNNLNSLIKDNPKYLEKNYKNNNYEDYVDYLNTPKPKKRSPSMIFGKNYQLPKFKKKT